MPASACVLLAVLAVAAMQPAAARHPGDAAVVSSLQPDARASFALDQGTALALSRAALGTTPGDYVMLDRDRNPVRLSSLRGKPVLVNFIYSGCFEVCPTGSRALKGAVDAMRARFGPDQFHVLSIGFDQPTDSPVALRVFAARQGIDVPNWKFLSPRAEDVPALARDFGFSFVGTPIGFEHLLQVSILDADGRIYRQVYGDGFAADSLGEPLKQLIAGELIADTRSWSDLIGRVRILCSVYDPLTGEYRADYTLFIEIAGGLTFLFAMLWFALGEWRSRRAARRQLPARTARA